MNMITCASVDTAVEHNRNSGSVGDMRKCMLRFIDYHTVPQRRV